MSEPSTSRPSAATPQAPTWLYVDVVEDAGDWNRIADAEVLIAAAVGAVARHAAIATQPESIACIALSDEGSVRRLNNDYRNQNKPTNVLSFPAGAFVPGGGPHPLGDVIIALETVVREAAEQGIEAGRHLQHLAVHGLLHLLGYDHETEGDAQRMEALEVEILASIGVANPHEGLELAGVELEPEGSRRLPKQPAKTT